MEKKISINDFYTKYINGLINNDPKIINDINHELNKDYDDELYKRYDESPEIVANDRGSYTFHCTDVHPGDYNFAIRSYVKLMDFVRVYLWDHPSVIFDAYRDYYMEIASKWSMAKFMFTPIRYGDSNCIEDISPNSIIGKLNTKILLDMIDTIKNCSDKNYHNFWINYIFLGMDPSIKEINELTKIFKINKKFVNAVVDKYNSGILGKINIESAIMLIKNSSLPDTKKQEYVDILELIKYRNAKINNSLIAKKLLRTDDKLLSESNHNKFFQILIYADKNALRYHMDEVATYKITQCKDIIKNVANMTDSIDRIRYATSSPELNIFYSEESLKEFYSKLTFILNSVFKILVENNSFVKFSHIIKVLMSYGLVAYDYRELDIISIYKTIDIREILDGLIKNQNNDDGSIQNLYNNINLFYRSIIMIDHKGFYSASELLDSIKNIDLLFNNKTFKKHNLSESLVYKNIASVLVYQNDDINSEDDSSNVYEHEQIVFSCLELVESRKKLIIHISNKIKKELK